MKLAKMFQQSRQSSPAVSKVSEHMQSPQLETDKNSANEKLSARKVNISAKEVAFYSTDEADEELPEAQHTAHFKAGELKHMSVQATLERNKRKLLKTKTKKKQLEHDL